MKPVVWAARRGPLNVKDAASVLASPSVPHHLYHSELADSSNNVDGVLFKPVTKCK